MRSSLRRTMTPLDVVQRSRASRTFSATSALMQRTDAGWYWLTMIVASIGVMFLVGAGNTPKSFAQTTAVVADDMPTMEDWEKLAQCESGGNWQSTEGQYSGGLQFSQDTWEANGGTGTPAEASKNEQIAIAEKLWLKTGWDSWPACGAAKADDFSIAKPTDRSKGSVVSTSTDNGDASDSQDDDAASDDEESDSKASTDEKGFGSDGANVNDDAKIERRERDSGSSDLDSSRELPANASGVTTTPGTVSEELLDPRFASPIEYASAVVSPQYKEASAACEFLTACRYRGINLMSYAPVLGGGDAANGMLNMITGIAHLLSIVAQTVFYGVEVLLVYALSVDFFTGGAYIVNEAFFKTGVALHAIEVGTDGNYSFQTPMVIVLFLGGLLATGLVGVAVTGRGQRNEFVKIGVLGILFSGLAILLIVRAGENVTVENGGTGRAAIASTLDGETLIQNATSSDIVAQASDSSNWAVMSPGWLLATFGSISNQLSAFVAQITNVATNAIANTAIKAPSQCDIYVNALYSLYAATPAGQNMGAGRVMTIISYDRMVHSLFYQNYAAGALGDTQGTLNSWCRIAERESNRPAGQQAMISRVAGLNREAVGTGGFGLIRDGNGVPRDGLVANYSSLQMPNERGIEILTSGGTLVTADGTWAMSDEALAQEIDSGDGTGDFVERQVTPASIAAQYFGPNYSAVNPEAARDQAKFYWAVCEWGRNGDNSETPEANGVFYPGGEATVNPEWKNIFWAKGGNGQQTFSKEDCTGSIISAKPGKGFGETWTTARVDDIQSAHFEFSVVNTALGEELRFGGGSSEGTGDGAATNTADNADGEEAANDDAEAKDGEVAGDGEDGEAKDGEEKKEEDDRNLLEKAWDGTKDAVVSGATAVKDFVIGKPKKMAYGAVNTATDGGLDAATGALDSVKSALEWLSAETPRPQDQYAQNFESAQAATGGNAAREYLIRSGGYNPSGAITTAIISLLVAYVVIRMIGGLIVGALIIQTLTLTIVAFGVLLLLVAIVPIRQIRNGLKTIGKTLLTAMITDGFLVFVFSAIFAINEVLRAMILPTTEDIVSSSILGGFIALLAFYSFNLLIKQFMQLDMTRVDHAVKLAPVAISPALNAAGFSARSPLDMARKSANRLSRLGRRRKRSTEEESAEKSAGSVMAKEKARQNLKRNFEDNNAMRRRRRAEADELRAQKRREKREKRKKMRMAGDALATSSMLTGVGAGYTAAYKTGSSVWRPLQDGAIATKNGITDMGRKASRLARDGASYSAQQARLLHLNLKDMGDVDEQTGEFVDNATPNSQATMTTEQQKSTGVIYPNADNISAFDAKIPGAADARINNAASATNVMESIDAHDAIPEAYGNNVSLDADSFSAESAHSLADYSSSVLNTPDSQADLPISRSMSGDDSERGARAQAQQQNMEQLKQRDAQRQKDERSRIRRSAEFAKNKLNDPKFREGVKNGATKLASVFNAADSDARSASIRREASAGGENRGVVGRAMRSAANGTAKKIGGTVISSARKML